MIRKALARLVELGMFLRIVDEHDRTVSLTNICFIVCVGKVATMQNPGLVDLAALMGAMLAYNAKRSGKATVAKTGEKLAQVEALAAQAAAGIAPLVEEVKSLTAKVVQINNRTGGGR